MNMAGALPRQHAAECGGTWRHHHKRKYWIVAGTVAIVMGSAAVQRRQQDRLLRAARLLRPAHKQHLPRALSMNDNNNTSNDTVYVDVVLEPKSEKHAPPPDQRHHIDVAPKERVIMDLATTVMPESTTTSNNTTTTTSSRTAGKRRNKRKLKIRKTGARPIVVEKYKLVFFQIPKVGSTTWKILFRRMMGLPNLQGDPNLIQKPGLNGLKFLTSYSPAEQRQMLTSPNWTRALFVRDPMERWLSAYLDKAVHHDMAQTFCCRPRKQCRPRKPLRDSPQACRQFVNRDCPQRLNASAEAAFTILRFCRDRHWRPQTQMIAIDQPQQYLNFVGHLGARDAKRLLQRLGAWEDFGATGWGANGTLSFFQSTTTSSSSGGQWHATHAHDKVARYIATPSLHASLLQYYRQDYDNPLFNLTVPPPPSAAS